MRKVLPVCLAFAICCASAQDSTFSSNEFQQENGSATRKLVASGIMAGIIGTSVVWSVDAWWQGRAHPFNFYNEGWFNDYSLGVDKAGHAFASYFYFHTFHNVMLWGGFDPSDALWWGAGITELLALCLEIGDGFSTYGFSYEDFVANTFGVSYGLLQTHVPFLQNFTLKWSYIPTGHRDALNFTQRYDAHTYWVSCNVHNLLPNDLRKYWPALIQLAAGYSIDATQTRREGVIGLDFNLEVFPPPNPDIHLVQKTLNMFHIPAPAVKFTERREPTYHLFHLN